MWRVRLPPYALSARPPAACSPNPNGRPAARRRDLRRSAARKVHQIYRAVCRRSLARSRWFLTLWRGRLSAGMVLEVVSVMLVRMRVDAGRSEVTCAVRLKGYINYLGLCT
eukprot:365900-Chlamydomonas_euryale.AAC.12